MRHNDPKLPRGGGTSDWSVLLLYLLYIDLYEVDDSIIDFREKGKNQIAKLCKTSSLSWRFFR